MDIEEIIGKIKSLYDQIENVDIKSKDYILNQLSELSGCNIHDAYVMGFQHGIKYEAQVIRNVLSDCEKKLKNKESE